ncbi:MAG: hypothetical protein WC764_03195 [Candidatus Paceibacterota bacterium]|jgi:hypothetical protein
MKKYIAGLLLTALVFVSGAMLAHAATLLEMKTSVASILEQVNLLPSTTIAQLQLKVNLLQGALSLQKQINALITKTANSTTPFVQFILPSSGLSGTHVTFIGTGFSLNDQIQIQSPSSGRWMDYVRPAIESGITIPLADYPYFQVCDRTVPTCNRIIGPATPGKTFLFRIKRSSDGAVSNSVLFEVTSAIKNSTSY